MITLDLSLPSACYPIHIGRGLLEQIGSLLPEYRGDKVAVVSNETIAPLYLTRLTTQLEARGLSVIPIILPEGEDSMDSQNLQAIFDVLLRHNCERHTLLIALGGGGNRRQDRLGRGLLSAWCAFCADSHLLAGPG
jgi:3-dehydroquinate synthase